MTGSAFVVLKLQRSKPLVRSTLSENLHRWCVAICTEFSLIAPKTRADRGSSIKPCHGDLSVPGVRTEGQTCIDRVNQRAELYGVFTFSASCGLA